MTCDVAEDTGKPEETSIKAKTTEQEQRGKRKVAQERMGKPRHKQAAAYNPHHYPQHTDYHRDQGFYPSQGGGRYKGHRYASHDNWEWRTDQQWTNGTDTYRDGEYRYYYYYRGNKNSRKTGSAVDYKSDISRESGKKRGYEQSSREDKSNSRASGRQKETGVDHVEKQPEHKTDEKAATVHSDVVQKIENTEPISDKDKDTVVSSTGKYRLKKSGYKSVPNTRKYEETTKAVSSTAIHPTTAHSHKKKQQDSKVKVSSSTHKEERTEKNEVVDNENNKADKDKGKGADGKDSTVNVPGKYHLKKSTFKSTTRTTNVEEDNQIDTKTISGNTSHGQKRRDYKAKNFRPVKHYGGVASSIQSDVLSQQLFSGQYECMVCCERVRVKDPVWSCSTCYHIFHLKCIKKWAKIPTNLENGTVCVFVFFCTVCTREHIVIYHCLDVV